MYKLGTLEQFNLEDAAAKKAAGWTEEEIKNGKISISEDGGEITESVVTNLIHKRQSPIKSDDYLWESDEGTIEDPFNLSLIHI